MATGAGKARVAVRSAEELHAGRVLVLVPSLDLLAQTEAAWHTTVTWLLSRLDGDAFDTAVTTFLQAGALRQQNGDAAACGRWPSTGSSCAAHGRATGRRSGSWPRWTAQGP
ncbi:hypothetical protein J2S47_006785 [Streptomyces griseoviridis]|uniref:Helicase/UvrB N-terminal domain-containing protein n=1 Tax=Streptomyces griseoviridis TaxID=45398 RepID=A0ABT9LRZ3_STRGD|nr:hypothetical protein [Streptomyces griseoviridis]